jgi:hypothetical protein
MITLSLCILKTIFPSFNQVRRLTLRWDQDGHRSVRPICDILGCGRMLLVHRLQFGGCLRSVPNPACESMETSLTHVFRLQKLCCLSFQPTSTARIPLLSIQRVMYTTEQHVTCGHSEGSPSPPQSHFLAIFKPRESSAADSP